MGVFSLLVSTRIMTFKITSNNHQGNEFFIATTSEFPPTIPLRITADIKPFSWNNKRIKKNKLTDITPHK